MTKQTALTLLLLFSLSAPAAHAAVYDCGNGRYSSKPTAGCRQADLPRIGSYTSERPREPVRAQAETAPRSQATQRTAYRATPATTPTPALAPAPSTAPRSSNGRRMILEQELANERRALEAAQKALTESRTLPRSNDTAAYTAHQARISSLQSDVLDRQQNVQALQRELSRM